MYELLLQGGAIEGDSGVEETTDKAHKGSDLPHLKPRDADRGQNAQDCVVKEPTDNKTGQCAD